MFMVSEVFLPDSPAIKWPLMVKLSIHVMNLMLGNLQILLRMIKFYVCSECEVKYIKKIVGSSRDILCALNAAHGHIS